ncbi:RNA-BINDING PROTEIN PNO1 [Salix viminalis]|uniref:RNA-BINDING PROTEIN PNO1 n=1 Tax=Salix viminalis TaxID=40686 RepID=A0A9Q0UI81_SALVM|nr:RNA-BINDING PROTEIN PNO1 [Salix viminalis]
MSCGQVQFRKFSVPPPRYSPVMKGWMEIYTPIYEQIKIDIRMDLYDRKDEYKNQSRHPMLATCRKVWVLCMPSCSDLMLWMPFEMVAKRSFPLSML